MNPTCACGRPVDGRATCAECTDQLSGNLRGLISLLPALEEAALGQARMGTGAPRSTRNSKLPFDERASTLSSEVTSTALDAVDELSRTVEFTRRRHAAAALDHLANHVDRLATQPWAAKLPRTIDDLLARVERAVDRPPSRLYCGECQCGHVLRALPGEPTARCPKCGSGYDVAQCRAELLARSADALVTAKEVSTALNVSDGRVRQWIFRKRLTPKGHRDARPVYALRDAMDLLDEQQAKIQTFHARHMETSTQTV